MFLISKSKRQEYVDQIRLLSTQKPFRSVNGADVFSLDDSPVLGQQILGVLYNVVILLCVV